MNGILISKSGDVSRPNPDSMVLDSKLPLLRANLKTDPPHYGMVTLNVASLAAGASKIFFRRPHRFPYTPSFLVQWFDPQALTNPNIFGERTQYGLGDFETFTANGIFSLHFYVTEEELIMEADNRFNGDPLQNQSFDLRYYIFVNGFKAT